MTTSTRSRALLVALATLVLSALGSLLLAAPASAEEKVVTITAEGVSPKVLEVASGDIITFVNEDTTFGYRARATSDNWDLDSGPVGLLPGRSYTHPDPITEPGTYTYRVAEGEPYAGSVTLAGPNGVTPAPKPSKAAPKPAGGGTSPAASPKPAASASPTGGSGTAAAPPVSGGFGTVDPLPTVPSEGLAPPPAIALPELPAESAGPLPETAPEPEEAAGPLAVPGRLGAPAGYRGYGLPAALAAVLAAGVASLLVRLLLAEPAARRRARSALSGAVPGSGPVATVD